MDNEYLHLTLLFQHIISGRRGGGRKDRVYQQDDYRRKFVATADLTLLDVSVAIWDLPG